MARSTRRTRVSRAGFGASIRRSSGLLFSSGELRRFGDFSSAASSRTGALAWLGERAIWTVGCVAARVAVASCRLVARGGEFVVFAGVWRGRRRRNRALSVFATLFGRGTGRNGVSRRVQRDIGCGDHWRFGRHRGDFGRAFLAVAARVGADLFSAGLFVSRSRSAVWDCVDRSANVGRVARFSFAVFAAFKWRKHRVDGASGRLRVGRLGWLALRFAAPT